jgi:hypothetical protein
MAHFPKLRRGPRRRRAAAAEDRHLAMESLQESLERAGGAGRAGRCASGALPALAGEPARFLARSKRECQPYPRTLPGAWTRRSKGAACITPQRSL